MSSKQSEAAMQAPEPKRRGRPPLAPGKRSDKRVRAIRLSDHHWAKLKLRGMRWLESKLDE